MRSLPNFNPATSAASWVLSAWMLQISTSIGFDSIFRVLPQHNVCGEHTLPAARGKVFFGGKEESKSRNRKTRFGLNNGQTWAVNGRLELAGDTAGLPKSSREQKGSTTEILWKT